MAIAGNVRALWMKVIIRAMFDMGNDDERLVAHTAKWLFELRGFIIDGGPFFNGLDNICRLVDLDAEKIRDEAAYLYLLCHRPWRGTGQRYDYERQRWIESCKMAEYPGIEPAPLAERPR